jgi:hypothetical protein
MGFENPGFKAPRPVSRLPFTLECRRAVSERLLSKNNGKSLASSEPLSYCLTGGQEVPFQDNKDFFLRDYHSKLVPLHKNLLIAVHGIGPLNWCSVPPIVAPVLLQRLQNG